MVEIDTAYLDFRMEQEEFAYALYGRWEHFYRYAFEEVVAKRLAQYDFPDGLLCLESIDLNLGVFPEPDFYEKFPARLDEKLDEFMKSYLLGENRNLEKAEVLPLKDRIYKWLVKYLTDGGFDWDMPGEYRQLSFLLEKVIAESAGEFAAALRYYGELRVLRERLVMQFADEELERVVLVLEPSEGNFINDYTRYLQKMHDSWKRPEVTAGNYRNVVWMLVFTYLLYEGKDFFSRKQLVYRTIMGLSAHYNMSFSRLLARMTKGIKQMVARWTITPELLRILTELYQEQNQGKIKEEMGALREMARQEPGKLPGEGKEKIRSLLADFETCHQFISPLKEEEVYVFVRLLLPAESEFVIAYSQALEREKQRGMFEGKAGSEFRLLKWDFIFRVLLNDPGTLFDRKRFVWGVLRQLAAHYNLDVILLLEYFYRDSEDLPEWLTDVLKLLGEEQNKRQPMRLLEATEFRDLTEAEKIQLREVLIHPVSSFTFLGLLEEEKIYRLAEVVCPAESGFILPYARDLDYQKERGAFEGKAGEEFRVIKWVFIFLVVLERPFNRIQFVYAVLRQLAAHYNLELKALLEYFYQGYEARHLSAPSWLEVIFKELQGQEGKDLGEGKEPKLPEDRTAFVHERRVWFYKQLFRLENFVANGQLALYEGETCGKMSDPYEIFLCLKKQLPEELKSLAEGLKNSRCSLAYRENFPAMRFYAAFLLWSIRYYGLWFSANRKLIPFLEKAEAGGIVVEAGMLRELAWYALKGDTKGFNQLAEVLVEGKTVPGVKGNSTEMEAARKKVTGQETEKGREAGRQEMIRFLELYPERVEEFVKSGEMARNRVLAFLKEEKGMQLYWIDRMGGSVLRAVAEELAGICRWLGFRLEEKVCIGWLVEYAFPEFRNLSRRELLVRLWKRFRQYLSDGQLALLRQVVTEHADMLPQWKEAWAQTEGEGLFREETEKVKREKKDRRWYIRNAGLVLMSSWYPRLFTLAGFLSDRKEFADKEKQTKAVFLLQHLLGGKEEYPEYELILNKLLTGFPLEEPLPLKADLSPEEVELTETMLAKVMESWEKMKNTSLAGFRESFLIREGFLEERSEYWQLTVEKRGYDVLLDSLPWTFASVKYHWMKKPVLVDWWS